MDNLHLIQLNEYQRPVITEDKNREWIGIGENNDYYQCLIDAFMDSTTNNAVINGIVDRIYGKGLDATDSHKKPEEYANMKSILKKKDLRRVCQDLKLLGEGSFQVTYQGKKIKSITHFPRETLRAEKVGEDGEVKNYLYSADWSKVTKNSTLKKFFELSIINESFQLNAPVYDRFAKKNNIGILVPLNTSSSIYLDAGIEGWMEASKYISNNNSMYSTGFFNSSIEKFSYYNTRKTFLDTDNYFKDPWNQRGVDDYIRYLHTPPTLKHSEINTIYDRNR